MKTAEFELEISPMENYFTPLHLTLNHINGRGEKKTLLEYCNPPHTSRVETFDKLCHVGTAFQDFQSSFDEAFGNVFAIRLALTSATAASTSCQPFCDARVVTSTPNQSLSPQKATEKSSFSILVLIFY